jgi:hypothetical protein
MNASESASFNPLVQINAHEIKRQAKMISEIEMILDMN